MGSAPHYVAKGSFDVPPEQWAAAKREARSILIQKAKEQATIPYSDLASLLSSVDLKAHDQRFFAMLGQIALEEHDQGRPLLSVLVVHKHGDMKPGPGFFELAASVGRDTHDADRAWVAELTKVFECWRR